jgi:hypothetical protein
MKSPFFIDSSNYSSNYKRTITSYRIYYCPNSVIVFFGVNDLSNSVPQFLFNAKLSSSWLSEGSELQSLESLLDLVAISFEFIVKFSQKKIVDPMITFAYGSSLWSAIKEATSVTVAVNYKLF